MLKLVDACTCTFPETFNILKSFVVMVSIKYNFTCIHMKINELAPMITSVTLIVDQIRSKYSLIKTNTQTCFIQLVHHISSNSICNKKLPMEVWPDCNNKNIGTPKTHEVSEP